MNCKKIQKFILTDYTDGELDKALKEKIALHIDSCASCRQLETELKKQVIDPLRKTENVEAPEALWDRIKEFIEVPEREKVGLNIQEFLDGLFAARKPVLAVISLLVVLLVGAIFTRSYLTEQNAMNVYKQDQLEFLESLTNGNGTLEDDSRWTEEFFL